MSETTNCAGLLPADEEEKVDRSSNDLKRYCSELLKSSYTVGHLKDLIGGGYMDIPLGPLSVSDAVALVRKLDSIESMLYSCRDTIENCMEKEKEEEDNRNPMETQKEPLMRSENEEDNE